MYKLFDEALNGAHVVVFAKSSELKRLNTQDYNGRCNEHATSAEILITAVDVHAIKDLVAVMFGISLDETPCSKTPGNTSLPFYVDSRDLT